MNGKFMSHLTFLQFSRHPFGNFPVIGMSLYPKIPQSIKVIEKSPLHNGNLFLEEPSGVSFNKYMMPDLHGHIRMKLTRICSPNQVFLGDS